MNWAVDEKLEPPSSTKSERRETKRRNRRKMGMSGRGVKLLQRLIQRKGKE